LFDPGGRGREERLSQGIDRIRRKYGFRSILRGRSRPRSASGGNG
ncbi:MAG: hypothetical protein GWO19_23285, partial [Nitrospinaceae bacterium]|nr:hypothetical protein [Nitrospinaceae bacterium]